MPTTVEETEKTETNENKKNELLLDSLEIKGYRCFEHLTIEKLGRVNLIVGKNNVGKTALLEALWIWAECNVWEKIKPVLLKVLNRRKEIEFKNGENFGYGLNTSEYRHLFYGRPKDTKKDFDNLLLIGEAGVVSDAYEFDVLPDSYTKEKHFAHFLKKKVSWEKKFPFGIHYFSKNGFAVFQSPAHLGDSRERNLIHPEIETIFIYSTGLDDKFLIESWDDIVWQNKENEIIETLKILSDEIINLTFTNYPKDSKQRIPVVHIKGIDEKVPLESFGEGMNRLLGLALALVNSSNGLLLIDEIEIGFHYSVLPDVWKLIFKTAKDLNVQVFATTHSKDCIEAFTQAAIDDEESDGMLIRLENKDGKIRAVNFNEAELETVERRNIEVR